MLVRWAPFTEMERLRSEMDRLFDGTLGRGAGEPLERGVWHPAFDVVEDNEKVVLTADLPGVEQGAIDVQVENDVLTVKGERKIARDKEQTGELYRRYERVQGAFQRQFRLSPKVDAEKITASLKDGVLTLLIPKRPEALPRQIKVNLS